MSSQATSLTNSTLDPGVFASSGNMVLLSATPWAILPQAARLLLCFAARYVSERNLRFKNALMQTLLNDKKNSFVVMAVFSFASAAAALAGVKPDDQATWVPPITMFFAGLGNVVTGAGERLHSYFNRHAPKPAPFIIRDPSPLWIPGLAMATPAAPYVSIPLFLATVGLWARNRAKGLAKPAASMSPAVWQGGILTTIGTYAAASGGNVKLGCACILYGLGLFTYQALMRSGGVVEAVRGLRAAPKPAV